jgi:hypothetical protein
MDDVSDDQTKHPRPPQATAACLIVMFGAVFAVLLMWDRIAALRTLDTRVAVQKFLDSPQSDGLGLSLAGTLTTVKVVSMTTAALAVAMAVQAFEASRRSRRARLALTIMVVPLFLLGVVGDGLVSSGAATFWCAGTAAATLTLWLGPVRLWFDGLDPSPASPRAVPGSSREATERSVPPGWPPPPPTGPQDPVGWAPPPHPSPYGSVPPPSAPATVAAPARAWAAPVTSAYDVPPPSAPRRPRALLWACVLTWVFTSLATLGLLLSLVLVSTDTDEMIDRMYRENPDLADQGISHQALIGTLYVIGGFALAAAVAAAVFAVLVFLRRRWAWYALVTSAALTALLFLLAAVTQPVSLVMVLAAAATLFCLARPEVKAWLLRR